MLTPQEVSERTFSKTHFTVGYNMLMVDDFLDTLTEDYTALYKENAALKAKMKVLADKIEEYRITDEAMRKTLLAAQTMADEMVREAQQKREELIAQAQGEAKEQLEALRREILTDQTRLAAVQKASSAAVAQVRELYQRELARLDDLSTLTLPEVEAPVADDPVAAAVAEIESNMERVLEEEDAVQSQEEEEDFTEEDPSGEKGSSTTEEKANPDPQHVSGKKGKHRRRDDRATRRLDLSDLRFGKEFDVK